MRKVLAISILILGACANPNSREELRAAAGRYSGQVQTPMGEIFIDLELDDDGFYRLQQSDFERLPEFELINDEGVYLIEKGRINLARHSPGLRYFQLKGEALYVLNPEGQDYSYPEDSNYLIYGKQEINF